MGSEEDEPRSDESTDFADRKQDPLVERLRRDPSEPPVPEQILEGFLGDSDRPGFRRLYFTAELDYYGEFRTDDVRSVADIPPERPPFLGEQATRVTLDRAAKVDFVRSQRAPISLDEFDLDVRLGGPGGPLPWDPIPTSYRRTCPEACGGLKTYYTCRSCKWYC